MIENTPLPSSLPSVRGKEVTAAFDDGCITSDDGIPPLSAVETKIGIADRLAPLINNSCNPSLVIQHR